MPRPVIWSTGCSPKHAGRDRLTLAGVRWRCPPGGPRHIEGATGGARIPEAASLSQTRPTFKTGRPL